MMTEELQFCDCGCGLRVTKVGNRFINGHNRRGVSNTPEHNDAISTARKGIQLPPRTPEMNATMSEILKNSEAAKSANDARRGVPLSPERIAAIIKGQEEAGVYEAQRGGNDLVTHHYIYDHLDLQLNTVKMTRSDHTSLHNVLRGLSYKVPHINTKEESQ